jgi:Rps23 Pro-64 3,4-dihydroxylase Tpa1-like proline 4-hydroxylase
MQLRLNPAIDVALYARLFAQQGYVQVPDLFEPEVATTLERILLGLPYRLVCQNEAEASVLLTRDELTSMPPEQQRALHARMRDRAAKGIGYTYLMYPMVAARLQDWDPGHPIHTLTDFLNLPDFLDFARALISSPGLTKVDAHASYYAPGHYLTTHSDDDALHGRAAYTIGFSRDWRPDWGGLLLMLDANGDVRRGLLPRFNTLTVFDGRTPHTVSAISAFTPSPRLSIAGWFRDDPPHAQQQG